MKRRKIILASVCFFAVLAMISCVSALSLVILERDISAYPGQIIDTQYRIQNMLGNGNITMRGSFSQEVEIASFPQGNIVFVPDQSEIPVSVRYKIPENAPIGKIYDIGVRFETIGGDTIGEGNIGFAQNIGGSVRIRIIGRPGFNISVGIDVKPGSFPNSINLRNKGLIPVAILTTNVEAGESVSFDASIVDPETVGFGPAGTKAVRWRFEDVDEDGDIDMILHFETQETGLKKDDTEAVLFGKTIYGQPFVGFDSVRIII